MNKTITATFTDKTTQTNVVDDLVNKDIPRENIYADKDNSQVKVMLPESAEPEVMEILNRHHPTEIH